MSFGKEIAERLHTQYPEDEYLTQLINHFHIFAEIYHACGDKFWKGCGSYLFDGDSYKYTNVMYDKQKKLYELAKQSKTALEIGVYMGHSQLIMLLANPTMKIVSIDIDGTYSSPAVQVLKKYFPESILELHIGDSVKLLESLVNIGDNKWSFIHIDGDHTPSVIRKEYELVKQYTNTIVFDDIDADLNWFNQVASSSKSYIIPDCKWKNMTIFY